MALCHAHLRYTIIILESICWLLVLAIEERRFFGFMFYCWIYDLLCGCGCEFMWMWIHVDVDVIMWTVDPGRTVIKKKENKYWLCRMVNLLNFGKNLKDWKCYQNQSSEIKLDGIPCI